VLLTGHYRQPLDWTDDVAADARKKLDRLYGALRDLGDVEPAAGVTAPQGFVEALEDDLNTPMALAELFELVRAANKAESADDKARLKAQLLDAGSLLGLLQQSPQDWFSAATSASELSAERIEQLIADRAAARKAKNFAESDRIRNELAEQGVLIEDGAQGTRWRRA
jgi:cysteinyl-tRNA synthetase